MAKGLSYSLNSVEKKELEVAEGAEEVQEEVKGNAFTRYMKGFGKRAKKISPVMYVLFVLFILKYIFL